MPGVREQQELAVINKQQQQKIHGKQNHKENAMRQFTTQKFIYLGTPVLQYQYCMPPYSTTVSTIWRHAAHPSTPRTNCPPAPWMPYDPDLSIGSRVLQTARDGQAILICFKTI